MKQIYWARSMQSYSDIAFEDEQLVLIRRFFPDSKIVNPREMQVARSDGMSPFFSAIDDSDAVVVSEYAGHVGAGANAEIRHAMHQAKPIYVLRSGALSRVLGTQIVNPKDKVVHYARLIVEGDDPVRSGQSEMGL